MPSILLVNPPDTHTIEAQLPKKYDSLRGPTPPLGLMYLSAYLKRKFPGIFVTILDCPGFHLDIDDLKKSISATRPTVVGIYAMSPTLLDALAVARAVREIDAGVVTVLGGPHPTLYPKESAHYPDIDFVIAGDGEEPLAKLVEMVAVYKHMHPVPNLFSKHSRKFEVNFTLGSNADLDALPFPDRTALDYHHYRSILTERSPITTMVSSRGCPYRCTYCIDRIFGGTPRVRSARNVADEMSACAALGIKEIFFYDDTFTIDRTRLLKLCDEIDERKLQIAWNIRTRVELVDYEMLLRAKQAGLSEVHFGVESGSDTILKTLKRGYQVKDIERAFALAHDLDIRTLAYLMLGAPGETPGTIAETISLTEKIAPDYIHVTAFMLYPRTFVYADALKKGIIDTDTWEAFARSPEPFTIPMWEGQLGRKEIAGWVDKFYRTHYLRPSSILHSLAGIGSIGALARNARVAIRMMMGTK